MSEFVTYFNTGMIVLMFSLLLTSISNNFANIEYLTEAADARSYANQLMIRLYSSKDCFAYSEVFDKVIDGKVIHLERVYPGVIDVSKFNYDNYLDCLENVYESDISTLQTKGFKDINYYVAKIRLIDLDNPERTKELRLLDTSEQLKPSDAFTIAIEKMIKEIEDFQIKLDIATNAFDIGLNLLLASLTSGTLGVDLSPVITFGNIGTSSHISSGYINLIQAASQSEEITVPVILKYEDGKEDKGLMYIKVRYWK